MIFMSGVGSAVEVELWPETIFQLQQYRDVEQLKIDRTRFTQYLTLNLFESVEEPRHLFFSSLRVDLEMGRDNSPDASLLPSQYQHIALLYAYYEWRRIGDMVDLTIGRQVLNDELGIYPMDGVRAVFYRNWHVGVDIYSGLEIKGALSAGDRGLDLPNSDTHEPDGLIDDDHMTGVFGASVFLDGFQDTQAKVQFRQRYSGATDGQDLSLFIRQQLFDIWEIYTVDSFSLLLTRFEQVQLGTTVDLDWIAINLEHASWTPTFDGDSIFNLFAAYSEKSLSANVYLAPDDKTTINLGYSRQTQNGDGAFFDSWGNEGNASDFVDVSIGRSIGEIADVRASYDFNRGWGGDYHRMALGGGVFLWQRRVRLDADWTGTFFEKLTYNDLLTGITNEGLSWGVSGKSTFRVYKELSLALQGDVYSNRFIERQFALYMRLEVRLWR